MDLKWDARRRVWLAYGCGFLGAVLEESPPSLDEVR
jgi:hypothetical protein